MLKEISEPAGAIIHVSKFLLGDPTLSTLEIWGAEYQESDAILVEEKDAEVLKKISKREKVPICFVGEITGMIYVLSRRFLFTAVLFRSVAFNLSIIIQ